MATIRQYFDTDFSHATKMHVSFDCDGSKIESSLFYDFAGYMAFLACYIPDHGKSLDYYLSLIQNLEYGKTQMSFDGKITLPSARQFPGQMRIDNGSPINVQAQFFGDPEWQSINDIQASKRVFIYSESDLTDEEVIALKKAAKSVGHELQFRAKKYMEGRTKFEIPLAFISHDSRDKDEVARKIAINLQRMLCPVWYDEFSLKVGNNLRDSIEKGLKECKKCILVLSPNFFSNNGWGKRELESIFTGELIEERGLVLPVWYNVTKQDVYNYSPYLLNVKGLDWAKLGEEEVSRQLNIEIMAAAQI